MADPRCVVRRWRSPAFKRAAAAARSASGSVPAVGSEAAPAAPSAPVTAARLGRASAAVVLVGRADGEVHVYAVGNATPLLQLHGHTAAITACAFDPREEVALAGGTDGRLRLWDLEHGQVVRTLVAHEGAAVLAAEFHPGGEFAATAGADGLVKVWDIRQRLALQTFRGPTEAAALAFSPDGRWLAVSSADAGVVAVWDLEAGRVHAELRGHGAGPVRCIEFHPLELVLAAAGSGEAAALMVWDLDTIAPINPEPRALGAACHALAFTPDGRALCAVTADALQVYGDATWERKDTVPWPALARPVDAAVAPLSTVLRVLGAHAASDGSDADLALRLVNTAQLATAGAAAALEPAAAPAAPPQPQEVDPAVAAAVDERAAWPKDQVFQKRDRIPRAVGERPDAVAATPPAMRRRSEWGAAAATLSPVPAPTDAKPAAASAADVLAAAHGSAVLEQLRHRLAGLREVRRQWMHSPHLAVRAALASGDAVGCATDLANCMSDLAWTLVGQDAVALLEPLLAASAVPTQRDRGGAPHSALLAGLTGVRAVLGPPGVPPGPIARQVVAAYRPSVDLLKRRPGKVGVIARDVLKRTASVPVH